uniref:PDZ domain-containing protein n=2 Tax=Photinus pyralis TaxID=7054 RepID=A0A1Y1NEW9_PHOPY
MAVELKFHRTDNTPWGFRLTGGADCDIPLTVIKVLEGSIADRGGLQVSDVIVRINDKPTANCTHADAHELILLDENDLLFAVRRDYYDTEDEGDENNNEVSNIMGNYDQFIPPNFASIHDNPEEIHNGHSSFSSVTQDLIAEAISGEAEVIPGQNVLGVNFNKVDLSQSTILKVMEDQRHAEQTELKDRQWSTFLQKPERPILKPKSKEVDQPKAPPYQVVIKKQKRWGDTAPLEVQAEVTEDTVDRDESPPHDEIAGSDLDVDQEECEDCRGSENEDQLVELDQDVAEVGDPESIADEEEIELATEEEQPATPPMEEQLAQVQMQLEALAQLPSSIQDTLDAVTKQLCKILNATQLRTEENKLSDSEHSSREASVDRALEEKGLASEEEEGEISQKQEHFEETDSLDLSERGSNFNGEDNTEVELISNQSEYDQDLEEQINEEEHQRLLMEEEKLAQQERKMNPLEESHQRRLEQRPTNPLAPVQRPIILPGGRRWNEPDDALPAPKKKSGMTDERICETLDMYSETIVGHTKGINFLKYQPPPKNLDYLQKSEVYKLIHDMEPPAKGIATRPGVVAAEQDYYQQRN